MKNCAWNPSLTSQPHQFFIHLQERWQMKSQKTVLHGLQLHKGYSHQFLGNTLKPVAPTTKIKISLQTPKSFLVTGHITLPYWYWSSESLFIVSADRFVITSWIFFRGLAMCTSLLGSSDNLAKNVHLCSDEICYHTNPGASSSIGQKDHIYACI